MDRREGRVDPEGGPMSWWLELKRTAPSLSRPQPAYVSSFPSRHPRLLRPAAAPRLGGSAISIAIAIAIAPTPSAVVVFSLP